MSTATKMGLAGLIILFAFTLASIAVSAASEPRYLYAGIIAGLALFIGIVLAMLEAIEEERKKQW